MLKLLNIGDNEKEGKYPLYNNGKIYKKVPWYDMEVDYIGINHSGSPGNCWLMPRCTSINNTCAYLYPKEDVDINIVWVFANVSNIHFEKYSKGSSIKGIVWDDFKNVKIYLPCNDEQNKIGDFIQLFVLKSKLVYEEIELWKLMKKAMNQNLFV